MERQFKLGDKVRVAADADGSYFGGETVGTVIAVDLDKAGDYADGMAIKVLAPAPILGGEIVDQWVGQDYLTLIEEGE